MNGQLYRPAKKTVAAWAVMAVSAIPLCMRAWSTWAVDSAWQHAHPHASGVPAHIAIPATIYGLTALFNSIALIVASFVLRSRFRSRRRLLTAWKAVVPSAAFGPLEPEAGFEILAAHKEKFEGDPPQIMFTVRRYRWSAEERSWRLGGSFDPHVLTGGERIPTHWVGEVDTELLVESWVKLCQLVGEKNAIAWQQELHRREDTRQKKLAEAAALAPASPVFELLPEAAAVLAGLTLPGDIATVTATAASRTSTAARR